ncbi:MBL fold metallo-hydrolase [Parvicella tangerina]|uniref:Ribonuclease J n=1 Tax=Parvicella tangerina TaxID=2829795 RepID=A0A916JRJ7_9FLAO|nr:MBL fold metallo-hydrolase [Parvicella tangerina]CAG5087727.1 Ribonuclease J [Parvicella tangerina]
MKAKIYRGTKEIGGTCVELTADNGKILWVDLGAPLDDKNPNIDYANNKLDALLISHPHQDHFGLMEKVGTDVPIYIGEVAFDFINATKIFIDLPLLKGNYKTIKPWQTFTIADTFKIQSFLTDHSTPESFSFIIEADGKRVFYSGDFRATGRKKIVFDKIVEAPPKNIDLLLIEGTMVERANHIYLTEESVEEGIYNILKNQKNVSFLISSAQNIDRLISIIRACKKTGKKVVIDVYTAWLLEMLHKQSSNVPTMEWDEVKVYNKPSQMEKITDKTFDEFRAKIKTNSVGASVFQSPSDFIYFVRNPSMQLVNALRKHGKINVIYSQWEGYLKEEYQQYFTDNINALKQDSDIDFHSIHTSGHAVVPDLMKFAKAINSSKITPIHTAFPEIFKKQFEENGFNNIQLWEDGIEYQI